MFNCYHYYYYYYPQPSPSAVSTRSDEPRDAPDALTRRADSDCDSRILLLFVYGSPFSDPPLGDGE